VIRQRTVLVLGAGASAPYGFPSGRKLRDDIIRDLSVGSTDLYKVVATSGSDGRQITNFRDALQKSGQPSVDMFLEYRSEFLQIGKIAIAAALIPYEKESTLWGGDDNWYEYLWQRLGPSLDEVKQSNLSVITFNYDRSLDHFLFLALRHSYNIGTDKASRILRDLIRIVHVHGKLGELPHNETGKGDSRGYRPSDSANLRDVAVAAAETIKIVHEGSSGDGEFVQARELLAQAQLIIFLGFGFLQRNVERLGITSLSTNIGLTGTAFGLLDGERDAVMKMIGHHSSLGKSSQGVLEVLRTHRLLV